MRQRLTTRSRVNIFWRRICWLLVLVLWSAAAVAQVPKSANSGNLLSSSLYQFNIPAQILSSALIEFAVDAHISVGYGVIPEKNVRSQSLIGVYSLDDALTLLLTHTGYAYQIIDPQTVRIVKRPAIKAVYVSPPFIDDIVVTATKRSQNIQSLPYSIAVAPGEMLEKFGISDTSGVALRLAGTTVTNLGSGRNKVFIRGLSDGAFSSRTQSTVGVYMDNTRLTFSAPDPNLMLVDIDRIEVLRGPQGTLYGAGSIGGIYRIVTNKPSLDFVEGTISTSGSVTRKGGVNRDLSAMINSPVIDDRFAVRAVGYMKRQSGYIDDTRLGVKNVNDTEILGGRLSALLKFNKKWSLIGGANYQKISDDDTQYFQADLKPLQRRNHLREPHDDAFVRFYLDLTGAFLWGEITSSTSYVFRDIHDRFDASLAVPTLVGLSVVASPFRENRDIKTFVHETRLASNGAGRFHWLGGVFLSRRNEDFRSRLTVPGAGSVLAIDPLIPDVVLSEIRDDDVKESAVFGEATLDLTNSLSVTAGLRGFWTTFDVASVIDGPANGGRTVVKGSNNKKGLTPKLVVSYALDEDLLLYAQASQGYRVGGVNINSPVSAAFETELDSKKTFTAFDSDVLWTYEGGAKTRWLDGRLVLNGAAYLTIWNDIQTDQIFPNGLFFVANAGDARIIGAELDAYYQPTNHLNLQANIFWNDSDLTESNPLLGTPTDIQLPAIPKFQVGASGTYERPIFGGFDMFVSADYAYLGRSSLTFGISDLPEMGGYHLANMRLGIASEAWRASLFVTNIGNSQGNTFAFGNPFSLGKVKQSTLPQPRTIGLDLTWTY